MNWTAIIIIATAPSRMEVKMNESNFVTRKHCPTCESTNTVEIYSCNFLESPIRDFLESFYSPQGRIEFEYLNGANFILEECNSCGTIFQKEIPNDFLIGKLYGDWISPKKVFDLHLKKDDLTKFSYYAQEVMTIIAFLNRIPSELKFLDFGMGWGKWCLMAKAFGCDSYGTELSRARIAFAQSQGVKVITWSGISNYSFDFINTEQLFEHISEPLETLRYLKKSLKSHGLIKISVPDGRDIKRRLKIGDWMAPKSSKNSLNPVSPLEHINCFKRPSIIRMADIVGLELIEIPMSLQLAYITNWNGTKRIIKNLVRPIYRRLFRKGTYLFFSRKKK